MRKKSSTRTKAAAKIFSDHKKRVSAMVQAGDAAGADKFIAKLRAIYLNSRDWLDKKAYDGAKSGRSPGRGAAKAEVNYTKINDFNVTKKILIKDDDNPIFTVALPIYKSKPIAWVAFESLAMQKNIKFSWELVIAEESHPDQIGLELSVEYLERLRKAGCKRLVYLEIDEWMPLYQKWMLIHQNSSIHSSKVFMLQAADCFSQLYRLEETRHLFDKHDPDWVQSKRGYFYNIKKRKMALYDHSSLSKHASSSMRTHPCCLNMAIKASLMGIIGEVYCKKGVDRKIYSQIEAKNGRMKVVYNESDSYLTGIDTDGYNNLSTGRVSRIVHPSVPFLPPKHSLARILPESVIDKMHKIK